MAKDTPTLKQTTDYFLEQIENKFPHYSKKQIKILFIEALCKNTVCNEIYDTCNFIVENQPELLRG